MRSNTIKLFILALLIGTSILSYGQDYVPCDKSNICRKCKKQRNLVYNENIKGYITNSTQRQAVKDNWDEVLFNDLDKVLPPKNVNANVISVKFDAMGCVYPDFMTTDVFNVKNYFENFGDRYLFKYTFYELFYPDDEADRTDFLKLIDKTIPADNKVFMSDLAKSTLMHQHGKEDQGDIDSLRAFDIFNFAEHWNNKYQGELIDKINQEITNKGITRLVFFVPGFNVPYALAQLQANNIIDKYHDELKNDQQFDKTLFVKLFWPSLKYKHLKLTDSSLNFDNMLTFKTAKSFNFVRNRVFNIGLQARKLIANISFPGEIDIIGHSSGSDLIGIILVDPIRKMNLQYNKNNTPYKREMARRFIAEKLPKKTIHAFLNAPSVPGQATFGDSILNRDEQRKYFWTIGFNRSDKVLQKLKGTRQRYNLANWGGNTSLGGDVNNAVTNTITSLKDNRIGIQKNFRFVELGKQNDTFGHDFFCYLNQDCFKQEFKRFVLRL